jgi:phage antirepressor YoqD-like protein
VVYCPKPWLSVHVRSLLNFYKKPYLRKVTIKQGQNWKIPRSKYMNRGSNKGFSVG